MRERAEQEAQWLACVDGLLLVLCFATDLFALFENRQLIVDVAMAFYFFFSLLACKSDLPSSAKLSYTGKIPY